MEKISFDEAYFRLMLLEDMRQLDLGAAAMAETLLLRARYGAAMRRYGREREAVMADCQGDEAAREAAAAKLAAEDSGCGDRRFSAEAFAGAVSAALGAGEMRTFMAAEPVGAAEWLDALTFHLADYGAD